MLTLRRLEGITMITKHEHILTLILLTALIVIKIWSVVTLFAVHAHTEELTHNMECKAMIKKAKTSTHQPIQ